MDTDGLRDQLLAIVGADHATFTPLHSPDDLRDESLHPAMTEPFAVVRPASTDEVRAICSLASRHGVALTPRGSGTGLSGAVTPVPGGIVVSFSRMNRLLRLDANDHMAVVQPGITLRELNEALVASGLRYPVYPGELSGSIGGNVNTNAGGMRAVRHGVTRHHVVGLELVLVDGTVLRTGGPVVKSSSGYDLTQLVIGSEGTLAMVTEVTLKLSPGLAHARTVLVPFASLEDATRVVPSIVASGLEPSIVEGVDVLTMAALTDAADFELGVDPQVAASTAAYLIVVLETRTDKQLEDDVGYLASLVEAQGALDVYVLASRSATRLIEARERLFWVTKASGAQDIMDIVVPRSRVADLLAEARRIAERHDSFIGGCGHVADGNVHLAVFQADDDVRKALMHELFAYGVSLGGQISGEHGIGRDKQGPFLDLSDPSLIELQRRIKAVFDPQGLLNPYRTLDARPLP
jgi:glycolate dehydrogenase FAD-linked subunit